MQSNRVQKRLKSYWKMELLNVALVPGGALWLAPPKEWREALALGTAIAPVATLLIVGGLYWRAVYRRTCGDSRAVARMLPIADKAERPALLLIATAAIVIAHALAARGWTPAILASLFLLILAGLEYVNYYHLQLQHFDHLTDLKRLLRARRLRPAHFARDLDAHRKRRRL
jgi:hypothetical protein